MVNTFDKTQIQLHRESQPPKGHKRKNWPGVLDNAVSLPDLGWRLGYLPPVSDVADVTCAHYNGTDKLRGLI